jgi:hypothetical protein
MIKNNKAVLAIIALTGSSAVFAAKPVKIKYIEDVITANNLIYSHYQVECSNGRTANISAWNNRKKWCVGKGRQDNCSKEQIKAAKKACQ